ncbi:UDP-glucuronosyltransferase 2B7-like, partial [Homarus americanus]
FHGAVVSRDQICRCKSLEFVEFHQNQVSGRTMILVLVLVGFVAVNTDATTGDVGVDAENGGKRVLMLHPMYAASHVLTLRSLARALVAKGHQVTVVRWQDTHHYPPANHHGITEIVLAINNTDGSVPHMTVEERASFIMPQKLMWSRGTSFTALPVDAFLTVAAFCRTLLGNTNLHRHLREQNFHVAIVYHQLGGEPQYTTAFSPPSSVPLILSHYRSVMTFSQRIINHLHSIGSHLIMQMQFGVTGYQISQYLPLCPSPSTLLSEMSGMLINSHPALDYPRLLPPSFINIGGLQVHPPHPLTQELEAWVAGSGSAGTILFSLGFIFNSHIVPIHVFNNLMNAFSRLPQRVLMKLEGSHPTPPPNVKIVTWIPQQDVLGHNNIVLFFTHCGMHGVLEALHHGVPMVGMPVFADQQDVLVRLEERGVAKGVHKEASEEEIYQAIVHVLNTASYRENTRRLSRIVRNHPLEPLRHAVWLVEHVAANQGAQYLKFSARHLNFCQFFGLDVFAFLLVATFCFYHYLIPLVKYLLNSLICLKFYRRKIKVT